MAEMQILYGTNICPGLLNFLSRKAAKKKQVVGWVELAKPNEIVGVHYVHSNLRAILQTVDWLLGT
jgi:hypothetical protein